MNLKYMKVSLFEITYKKKWTFSRHSNLLRCTCTHFKIFHQLSGQFTKWVCVLKRMPGQAFLRDCPSVCIYVCNLHLNFVAACYLLQWCKVESLKSKGKICVCVRERERERERKREREGGGSGGILALLAISFEWQAANSHWSWKGECKHTLTHTYFHRQTERPHSHIWR